MSNVCIRAVGPGQAQGGHNLSARGRSLPGRGTALQYATTADIWSLTGTNQTTPIFENGMIIGAKRLVDLLLVSTGERGTYLVIPLREVSRE